MSRLKYMGTSHKRNFLPGDDWGGRLAEPLDKEISFDLTKGHIVDTEKEGISDDVASLLLEDDEIIDVSDYSVAPTGQAEEMWHGRKPSEGRKKDAQEPEGASDSVPAGEGVPAVEPESKKKDEVPQTDVVTTTTPTPGAKPDKK